MQLTKWYMNLHEYQRSRSFIDVGPRSVSFNILFVLLRNRWADWSQISTEYSMGSGDESLFKWSRSQDQYGRHVHIIVTGSDILSLVEVQRRCHKTWDKSDVIKFAGNVYWVSAHWLNSLKVSPEEYDAAFWKVSFTFCICILSDFFHILDQWKEMSLVIKVYPTCMLFTPVNGNEDGKLDWCEFCYFSQ